MQNNTFTEQFGDYRVFIDTCSLMEPTAWTYIRETLMPVLKAQKASLILPLRVLKELRRLNGKEGVDSETASKASSGLATVALMLGAGVLEIMGSEEESTFADNYFLYTFTKLRLKYNLALITQDRKLAFDIHNLANQRSVQGRKKILLLKIKNGELVEWDFDEGDNKGDFKTEIKARFEICKQPRKKQGNIIPVNKVPSTGDVVNSQKCGQLVLKEQAVKTRNGYIYHCTNGYACKIYNAKKLTTYQKNKIEKMLEIDVQIQGVCWPLDMAHNQEGQFVGYIMTDFTGNSLKETVFTKKSLVENGWTRLDLVELCLTWLKIIKQLHDINVLIGDVNPPNVFVKSAKEVILIEADKFQVEDFPCPQRSIDYIAPELRGHKPGTYLQTKEQEEYAIATLIFMVLLPGKHPFSCYDGNLSRLRCLEFPYPLGERTSSNTPGKPWNYIWSNLPYKIKKMFSDVFRENQQVSTDAWLKALSEYSHLLEGGYFNNELFPERRKILNPCEVTCACCGAKEIQEKKFIENISAEGKKYYCENCLESRRRNGEKKQEPGITHKERPPFGVLIQGA